MNDESESRMVDGLDERVLTRDGQLVYAIALVPHCYLNYKINYYIDYCYSRSHGQVKDVVSEKRQM
jgi:hypothetical protein